MRQLVGRTARRSITREELWNGNCEPLRNWLRWDPRASVIRWAWSNHTKYRDRFESAMRDPALAHLHVVRLTSHAAADAWLAGVRPDG